MWRRPTCPSAFIAQPSVNRRLHKGADPCYGLKLQLDSVYSSNTVVLFASTNLVNWLPILTNPPTRGSVLFLDVAATNMAQRFYRATER